MASRPMDDPAYKYTDRDWIILFPQSASSSIASTDYRFVPFYLAVEDAHRLLTVVAERGRVEGAVVAVQAEHQSVAPASVLSQ